MTLQRVTLAFAILLVGVLSALQVQPAGGQGQQPLLERLEIAMWPEFDRQAVLLIYRFQFPASAELPATVALPIPAEAGEPHAVAWQDEAGNLLLAQYTRSVEGEWATILVQSESLRGQLEYYAELQIEGDQRSFNFRWPGGPEVIALAYEVQEPVGSRAFTVSPAADREGAGAYGMTHAFGELGSVSAGQTFTIDFGYLKSDSRLSFDSVRPPQSQPALGQPEAPTGRGFDPAALVPWVVGLGIALVLAGVIWYLRSSRPAPARARVRRRAARSRGDDPEEIEASPLYCQQCGTKAGAGDLYCRQCGTKLRGR